MCCFILPELFPLAVAKAGGAIVRRKLRSRLRVTCGLPISGSKPSDMR
jgi:hypothetical protein